MKVLVFLLMVVTSIGSAQDWRLINPSTGSVPEGAFKAGDQADGNAVYIMRYNYQGSLCIGKYVPKQKYAYISYGGNEILIQEPVEVFCGFGYWVVADSYGQFPGEAIVGGAEADGTPLYMIRTVYKGHAQAGKYSVKNRAAYFPFDGKEYEIQGNYSVLIRDPNPEVIVRGGMAAQPAAAKKLDYRLVINYEGTALIKNTGTKNNITILALAHEGLFNQTFNTFQTPAQPFSVNFSIETPVQGLMISTDGDDGFRMSQVELFKIEGGVAKSVAKWGSKGAAKGYCLSTDPNDNGGEWTGAIEATGCRGCLNFDVESKTVYPCEEGGM